MFRTFFATSALFLLAACGEANQALNEAKEMAGEAAKAAAEMVDTQTACTLAGQNEAFCGCAQEALGPKLTGEHVQAFASIVKASLVGDVSQAIAENTVLTETERNALVQCTTRAAIAGAVEPEQN
jgi:hypothetical protein